MKQTKGTFVISLDFELLWGMVDRNSFETYKENVAGVRTAIPKIVTLFQEFDVHATWATIGMIAHKDKKSLEEHIPAPSLQPQYTDMSQSAYAHLNSTHVGDSETDDPYHYGDSLVRLILKTPNQEMGSHTFSHLYALDVEEDTEVLKADCKAVVDAFSVYGVQPRSLVFPRNQVNQAYLKAAVDTGIVAYRGNEKHFLYKPRKDNQQTYIVRALRLIDHYVNITGHHTYSIDASSRNVQSSRFLRPFNPKVSFLESLKIRRIKKAMTHAAVQGEVFHLWWHPHNFGIHQDENMRNLQKILEHYQNLQSRYGMQSCTMEECVTQHNHE